MENNISLEEQETHVWIDYLNREINIFTARPSVYRRLESKLGEPDKINKLNGKICDGTWKVKFEDKKILSSVLNRTVLVGGFR